VYLISTLFALTYKDKKASSNGLLFCLSVILFLDEYFKVISKISN